MKSGRVEGWARVSVGGQWVGQYLGGEAEVFSLSPSVTGEPERNDSLPAGHLSQQTRQQQCRAGTGVTNMHLDSW